MSLLETLTLFIAASAFAVAFYMNRGDEDGGKVMSFDRETKVVLNRIERKLDLLLQSRQVENAARDTIMATLDEILADVTAEEGKLDSIAVLLAGLKKQVADALSSTTLPPAVQDQIDHIFTHAETNKGKIAAALAANS